MVQGFIIINTLSRVGTTTSPFHFLHSLSITVIERGLWNKTVKSRDSLSDCLSNNVLQLIPSFIRKEISIESFDRVNMSKAIDIDNHWPTRCRDLYLSVTVKGHMTLYPPAVMVTFSPSRPAGCLNRLFTIKCAQGHGDMIHVCSNPSKLLKWVEYSCKYSVKNKMKRILEGKVKLNTRCLSFMPDVMQMRYMF